MFLVKSLGIILIITSSTLVGLLKSKSLRDRQKKLALLLDGTDIFLNYVQQEYELNFAIKNAFSKCDFLHANEKEILCLDNDLKKEKALIENFFFAFGNSTKKMECDRINCFIKGLESKLKEAQNDVKQKGKVYQMLGICVGLTIGILLI